MAPWICAVCTCDPAIHKMKPETRLICPSTFSPVITNSSSYNIQFFFTFLWHQTHSWWYFAAKEHPLESPSCCEMVYALWCTWNDFSCILSRCYPSVAADASVCYLIFTSLVHLSFSTRIVLIVCNFFLKSHSLNTLGTTGRTFSGRFANAGIMSSCTDDRSSLKVTQIFSLTYILYSNFHANRVVRSLEFILQSTMQYYAILCQGWFTFK